MEGREQRNKRKKGRVSRLQGRERKREGEGRQEEIQHSKKGELRQCREGKGRRKRKNRKLRR